MLPAYFDNPDYVIDCACGFQTVNEDSGCTLNNSGIHCIMYINCNTSVFRLTKLLTLLLNMQMLLKDQFDWRYSCNDDDDDDDDN